MRFTLLHRIVKKLCTMCVA